MLFCKVLAVVLLVHVSNAQYNAATYYVPEPLIEVLKPRGFRISIENSPGIEFVRFRTNISEEGEQFGEVRRALQGRWTFEEHNVCLETGDRIYYTIFVVKGNLGYPSTKGKYYEIREPESNHLGASNLQLSQAGTRSICNNNNNNNKSQESTTTVSPASSADSSLPNCQQLFLNCSQSLLTLQSELEDLRTTNQQLTAFIEKYPDAKKLTLSGRIPPDDNPVVTATFIIREKLELNPDIVSAVRNSDNNIEFMVATMSDKLEILKVAKEKLANSRIMIS